MRILASAILTMATVSVTASARAQTYNPKYPICLKVIQKFGVNVLNACYFSQSLSGIASRSRQDIIPL